ncbi:MAG: non-homologous end-joining DNA ligase, partial [Terracidiphilus sp.]
MVQKHAATRLHYDFRLGWDGVLKSWAVTKGPSYYPGDKRLAVQVEDHPWDYRDFEGTIPKGQYGGGTVMVWDEGEWLPLGDVDRGLNDGHLKFELRGKKLKGHWTLIRMHGGFRRNGRSDRANWLLIKEKDEFAREEAAPGITEDVPDSAISGRSIEEIAAANDRVWNSHRNGDGAQKAAKSNGRPTTEAAGPRKQTNIKTDFDLNRFPQERFPGFIAPQLAQQTAAAPSGDQWLHELKLDGYRIQIHLRAGKENRAKKPTVQLFTRKGLDWTARMPDIAEAARELNVESAILDGEAVVLDDRGVSSFAELQAVFYEGRQKYIAYFAFDLLHLNGHNLRGAPLTERKALLKFLIERSPDTPLRLSEAIDGDGLLVYEHACSLGAEGIVSKLTSAPYTSGRAGTWLKTKCRLEQEFVIGGITLPTNGTHGVGALLLGYYEDGKLCYAGRAGTGFTEATHRKLRSKLDVLASKRSAFRDVPAAMQRGAHWLKPELVAQVAFSNWTRDDLVRQAAFKG